MKVTLREVKTEDGANIAKWRNSVKVLNHCIDKTVISEESNKKFFEDMVQTGKYVQYIVERFDEEFGGVYAYQIGTTYFKDIDNENHKCELGMFPSDDEEWNSEGQELAVKEMVKRAFSEMKMHKLYAYVYSDCHEEITLLEKCGFAEECEFLHEIYDINNNSYRNVKRLSIFRERLK